ncbi:MAG TPA: hypothetical protein VFI24_25335 [Pyrinomonadaceae bacterium]|nr:hypothetical protein [Pyrinomonadaceae bacterium]
MRLSNVCFLLLFLIACVSPGRAQSARPRPEQPAKGRQAGVSALQAQGFMDPEKGINPVDSQQSQCIAGPNHGRSATETLRFRQDGEAYELLSRLAAAERVANPGLEMNAVYGTAGFATKDVIAFFKGTSFVRLSRLNGATPDNLSSCAHQLSDAIDKGEGEIPALLKHLPNPEEAQKNAVYLNSFADLQGLPYQHFVFDAVQSGGNADAVLGTYGTSKLLILEFNTPQLATENDKRIIARIQELWKLGQPAPSAYRRVGNYSVLVFDAPDEQTAKQLIDQVKYEQVVQWLGENPNILKDAQKRYVNTTLGVLVTVLKASGYALITCLGMGALIGGLLFSYRRSQQKAVTAYSDAGGMLRLNLDDMTAETNSSRLLQDRN